MDQNDNKTEINIPKCLQANGHDIFNYTSRYGGMDYQVHAVLKLNGRLDPNKLIKAVRLSVDAQPILGCQFMEDERKPYWIRYNDIDKIMFCSMEETDNPHKAIKKFLNTPFKKGKELQLKVKLIRSDTIDTLCIKLNHASCDGTGAKDYIMLLSNIYNNLDYGNDFIPIPANRDRREQDRIFESLGIKDPESAWDPIEQSLPPTWSFPWYNGPTEKYCTAICKLPLNQMFDFAKAKGAKMTDLLLTAYYRAMFIMLKPSYLIPMEIFVTVDLRRYIPNKKTEAVRNLSGSVAPRLCRLENETFAQTLLRVTYIMNEIKNKYPGLQSAIGLERLENMPYNDIVQYRKNLVQLAHSSGNSSPVLSNMGFISKSLITFGDSLVEDVYIVTPAVYPPGFLLGVSSYNGKLTLTVTYFKGATCKKDVERFLELFKKELLEGCR